MNPRTTNDWTDHPVTQAEPRPLRNEPALSPTRGMFPLYRGARSLIVAFMGVLAVFSAPLAALDRVGRESAAHDESGLAYRRAMQDVIRAVVDRVRPSVVRIETIGGAQPVAGMIDDEGRRRPAGPDRPMPFVDTPGSGFVVADGPTTGLVYSTDGYIITSSFNFARDPALISVTLADGRRFAADLVARDQVRKIALLKIDADDLPVPEWSAYKGIRVGQSAIALGMGFGGEEPAVTLGVVSALQRMRGNAIQTDAKLSPVNYGGPVCDIDGRVVGLSVPMAQRPGELAGIEMYDSGVGFAVPAHRVEEIVSELKTGRSFYRGWLGIQIRQTADGLFIGRLADPSPLAEVGAMAGDRIASADGHPIRHFGNLVQTLYMIPAGELVTICLERDGAMIDVDVVLARNIDLGPLPAQEEPFDPSLPLPDEDAPPELPDIPDDDN